MTRANIREYTKAVRGRYVPALKNGEISPGGTKNVDALSNMMPLWLVH